MQILGETGRSVTLDDRGVEGDTCVDLGECKCGHGVVRRLEDKSTHANCRVESMILQKMRISMAMGYHRKLYLPIRTNVGRICTGAKHRWWIQAE